VSPHRIAPFYPFSKMHGPSCYSCLGDCGVGLRLSLPTDVGLECLRESSKSSPLGLSGRGRIRGRAREAGAEARRILKVYGTTKGVP